MKQDRIPNLDNEEIVTLFVQSLLQCLCIIYFGDEVVYSFASITSNLMFWVAFYNVELI